MISDPAPVEEAITSRRSIRAFLPDPIPRATVERLLAVASRSASGSNIQPWKVRVLAGEPRMRLSRAIVEAIERDGNDAFKHDYDYYPVKWHEPFLSRRRKIGWDMYSLIGVTKGDFEGTERHRRRNFEFFGAPVGMIFTLDEDLEIGSWIDLGIFMGAVMVAARARGLHTCPQAAFAEYHSVIRRELTIPDREMVICGMALGYADEAHPINRLVTERATVEEFATFDGFGGPEP
jgi:nitroreductase